MTKNEKDNSKNSVTNTNPNIVYLGKTNIESISNIKRPFGFVVQSSNLNDYTLYRTIFNKLLNSGAE